MLWLVFGDDKHEIKDVWPWEEFTWGEIGSTGHETFTESYKGSLWWTIDWTPGPVASPDQMCSSLRHNARYGISVLWERSGRYKP